MHVSSISNYLVYGFKGEKPTQYGSLCWSMYHILLRRKRAVISVSLFVEKMNDLAGLLAQDSNLRFMSCDL